jgi:hypothetical protein
MLVYGDHSERAEPRQRLAELRERLALVERTPAGLERHSMLVSALVEAGQLLQGLADGGSREAERFNGFVHRLAGSVVASYDAGLSGLVPLPGIPHLDELPAAVELRLPEGFAFYAVYPESYVAAARRLKLRGEPRVIGIRSIGTTLGAIVAAALGAPPPVSVRPFGDPFARAVELPVQIMDAEAHYVIVDEGPGQSGSSFGAIADWLERHGVARDRIAFVPSHGGDLGPHASEAHRQRWCEAQRVPAEFDERWLCSRFGPLEDYSTGHPWERRKYLATRDGERLLLKFAGLGASGERKLAMARALHGAGFTPEPVDLVHGFLVERWCEGARPLGPRDKPVKAIGRYIGARARRFPAEESSGATIDDLLNMCRRNLSLALGEDAVPLVERWDVDRLSRRGQRVRTDNKLERHEWLRTLDGGLLKTDALDHHQGHDLIGCQDLAWDVAGAIAEFDLDNDGASRLIAATGQAVDGALLDFHCVAYSCFRLGQAVLGAQMTGSSTAAGHELKRSAKRHEARLRHLLHEHASLGTRHECLVG